MTESKDEDQKGRKFAVANYFIVRTLEIVNIIF